jgi:hypothetical protein
MLLLAFIVFTNKTDKLEKNTYLLLLTNSFFLKAQQNAASFTKLQANGVMETFILDSIVQGYFPF